MSIQPIALAARLSEFRQGTIRLCYQHPQARPVSATEAYLVLESYIKVILYPLAKLLAILLIFPHPSDRSRDLGIGLIHARLKGLVERCCSSFEILDATSTTGRLLG